MGLRRKKKDIGLDRKLKRWKEVDLPRVRKGVKKMRVWKGEKKRCKRGGEYSTNKHWNKRWKKQSYTGIKITIKKYKNAGNISVPKNVQ